MDKTTNVQNGQTIYLGYIKVDTSNYQYRLDLKKAFTSKEKYEEWKKEVNGMGFDTDMRGIDLV